MGGCHKGDRVPEVEELAVVGREIHNLVALEMSV